MITDFCEIEDFFMNMVGVEMIVKVYLIRIKEEIKILKNPLIKGERVKFEKAEFPVDSHRLARKASRSVADAPQTFRNTLTFRTFWPE